MTVLIVNADIVTMNPDPPRAEAMAFAGDRIVAIGSEAEVRKAVGDYDKFFNLKGQTVVPGFIESHDHLYMSRITNLIPDVSPYKTPTLTAQALTPIMVMPVPPIKSFRRLRPYTGIKAPNQPTKPPSGNRGHGLWAGQWPRRVGFPVHAAFLIPQ